MSKHFVQWKQSGLIHTGLTREKEQQDMGVQRLITRRVLARAKKLEGQHQYKEALACYEQALRLDPTDADSYNTKSALLLVLGRPREALERCSQGLSLYQNRLADPRPSLLLSHLFHGSMFLSTALVLRSSMVIKYREENETTEGAQ